MYRSSVGVISVVCAFYCSTHTRLVRSTGVGVACSGKLGRSVWDTDSLTPGRKSHNRGYIITFLNIILIIPIIIILIIIIIVFIVVV